jgi:hypothetical protein
VSAGDETEDLCAVTGWGWERDCWRERRDPWI